jgi:hypothetical protein
MKKFIIGFCLLLLSNSIFSQATTDEEFTYVRRSLVEHFTKGESVKAGYKLVPLSEESTVRVGDVWRSAKIYYFKKIVSNKNVAFAIECKDVNGGHSFLCIPTENASEELWDRTFSDMAATGKEWHVVFTWALSKLISKKVL